MTDQRPVWADARPYTRHDEGSRAGPYHDHFGSGTGSWISQTTVDWSDSLLTQTKMIRHAVNSPSSARKIGMHMKT